MSDRPASPSPLTQERLEWLIAKAEIAPRGHITDYYRALHELRQLREAKTWMPIESAPKDRRIMLGKIVGHPSHPTALWWAVAGQWSERWKNWNDGVEPSGLAGPTHWHEILPLPAPPTGE